MPTSARHATRALLRAHLNAASGYRHLTRHCAVCHRLLRLAMEGAASAPDAVPAAAAVKAAETSPCAPDGPEAPAPPSAAAAAPGSASASPRQSRQGLNAQRAVT
ncbi:DUF6274 family protein [Streptomyces sp. GC420]|uniref:DUF6274 family protein n=1 Tax=Streptomyces sp. GC420 TaxID=2697568 RepID=UPI00141524E8|nr:DUF6274 family protein [Streptomyces sp. GC420]NBM18791.1 hypothetical protein [Streptomyces sp. GC420]